jgi:tetratricopeptide (TPR) repeat protein
VPVLNVFYRTGEVFAELFLSLPVAGFAAFVVFACAGLPPRARGIAASVTGGVVLVFAALFFVRARDWTSQRTLVEAQLRDAPEVGGSWQIVAADLLDELGVGDPPAPEDVARAGALLTRALEISPGRAVAAVTLAKVHLRAAHGMSAGDPAREPRLREAERLFRAALQADPKLRQARGALGLVLLDLGRRRDAEEMMREELRLHPDDHRATSNLALLLDEDGRSAEAREVREAALRAALANAAAHPDRSGPLVLAARFAYDLGRKDEARELARRSLLVTGEGPDARARGAIGAANLLRAVGEAAEARAAIAAAREQLAADRDLTPARALAIASLDQALGDGARARAVLEAALPTARGMAERKIRAAMERLR